MNGNGGAAALPTAVNTFLSYFDENVDQLALVTFSTTSTVNVTTRTMWKTVMTSAVNSMVFGGATYSVGGLTDGKTQIDNGVTNGQNVVKVAVFFTDGFANTLQDNLACGRRNFGGYDAGSTVGIFDPNTGAEPCWGAPPGCCGSTFTSQIDGTTKQLVRTNVGPEAEYRAVQMANARRAKGVTVYAIGLGNSLNKTFLQQVANDPASPTFDSSQPVGEADFAGQAADLNQVFQTVASKILLRLTR